MTTNLLLNETGYPNAPLDIHAQLRDTLQSAKAQIEYLQQKFNETGSGNGVLAQIDHVLALADAPKPQSDMLVLPVGSMQWAEAQRICDLPEVDEAMRNFSQDSTGDNATCLVRAILKQTEEQAKNAARWLAVRNIADDQMGVPGVLCVSMPSSSNAGEEKGYHANGEDADRLADAAIEGKKQ